MESKNHNQKDDFTIEGILGDLFKSGTNEEIYHTIVLK